MLETIKKTHYEGKSVQIRNQKVFYYQGQPRPPIKSYFSTRVNLVRQLELGCDTGNWC